jgi:hypothetical protein
MGAFVSLPFIVTIRLAASNFDILYHIRAELATFF